mgnify:CR=1 FL=1
MMQYVMITNEYKAISDVTPESSLRCLRLSRKAGGRQCRLGSPPLGWRRLYRNPHERVRHLPRALLQRHGRLRRGIVLGICAPLGFAPGACAGCSVSAAKSAVYAPWAIWIARNTPCQLAMTDATANQLANTQRHVCTTHLRRPARAYPHGRSACSSPAPGAPTRSGAPAAPAALPALPRCAALQRSSAHQRQTCGRQAPCAQGPCLPAAMRCPTLWQVEINASRRGVAARGT